MWPFTRSAEDLFRNALACQERGDHASATKLFLKASKIPGRLQADSFFNAAVSLVRLGDHGGAASAYASFLSLSPEAWSPDLQEYIQALQEASTMGKPEALQRIRDHESAILRRQETADFGGRDVRFEAFFDRILQLVRTTYERESETFALRADKLSAKVPLTVYHYPPLSRLSPPAAFQLCSSILLWGVAIGHAIRLELGDRAFQFTWPEPSKIHYSEAELSRSVSVDWVYVRRATDSVIDRLLERIDSAFPGIGSGWRDSIRENLVKEFVFLGLGLAINCAPHQPGRTGGRRSK